MKIEDILQQPHSLPVSKKGAKTEGTEIDFQKFLEDAKARRSEGQPSGSPALSGPEIEGPPPAVFPLASNVGISEINELNQLRFQGIKLTENTLNLLEEYQKDLEDPRKTLKEIESLVRSLSEEVKNLNTLSEKVSPSDPLQKIMAELSVLSTVEIEKFKRGEYV